MWLEFQLANGNDDGGNGRIIVQANDISTIQESGTWQRNPENNNIFVTNPNRCLLCMENGHQWDIIASFDIISETFKSLSNLKGGN